MLSHALRTLCTIAMTLPAFAWAQCNVADSADYRIEFTATWSSQTLPQQFPASAHFSGLVGGSHNAQVTFWEAGALASDGIEVMAETGSKNTLLNEVNAAIGAGNALDVVNGGGIGLSPGFVSTTFTADQDHPLATVVTMIAPSPDWFVGVSGHNLLVDGNWLADVTVELYGYDAGTDSGVTYTSSNSDTQPPVAISPLTSALFMHDGELVPFGTFRFVRLTESCLDSDADDVADEEDNCSAFPNPNQIDADGDGIGNDCDADLNNDCVVNPTDLGLFRSVFFSADPVADFDSNGVVNPVDLGRLRSQFFQAPGPSGIANLCD